MTNYNHLGEMVKATWLKLTPFILSVAAYFILMEKRFYENNLLSTILKCLPILLLMVFIWTTIGGLKFTQEFQYHRLIFLGLIFSVMGDALLDFRHGELFPFGMAAFALAQITYITAFGWKPFKPILGLLLFLLAAGMIAMMFKNFHGILVYGVPIYCSLLVSMVWRANARLTSWSNLPRALCAVSSFYFLFSDAIIAFDKFYTPINYSKYYIMPTYYVAQLGITLSILDHELTQTKKSTKRGGGGENS